MKNFILFFTILFFSTIVYSQNHGRFWYFGENAGLDFSTSPPTALNNGALWTYESCSSISDDLGNLLFYTDGTTVFNANHIPLLNGTGLFGNPSAAQQLIVRNRTSTNLFTILTVSPTMGLSYTLIDMNLDNGLGAVVPNRKNILINPSTHEKVTAYIDPALTLSWIITYKNSGMTPTTQGTYYAYRLINGSIDVSNPVVSVLPSVTLTDARGMLKLSPDGTKIVNTSIDNYGEAFLTDFNPLTGVVSNPVKLMPPSNASMFDKFHGAEFSPDSNLVYLNANTQDTGNTCGSGNQREIFQYNLNGGAAWNSNPVLLGGSIGANSGRGSLQLGPDGKIYFARTCQPWLGVIEHPTIIGVGASYIDNAIPLVAGTQSREGLPNIALQAYSDTFNTVQGSIKFDTESNGCTSSDPVSPNILLGISSSSYNSHSISNNTGDYLSFMPNGQFTISPQIENPSYWTFSPPNYTVNFPTQASPSIQDFCVRANGSIEDLEVIVLPLKQARPGFDTDYKVVIKNKGNQTASGTVTLDFEENFMTLLSSNPIAGNTVSNQLSWSFTGLQPFQIEKYEFTMVLNTPTQSTNPLNGGDMLTFTGTVTGTGTDAMPVDNIMAFDQKVLNSYDPNDKICLEGEYIDPTNIGEYVHYMIRFENIGTASAVNIVVKDEIDLTQFDITTLVPLGGSHNYHTKIKDNVVEFIHEDINLDFNDATNDGYVLFKIKTLMTLREGDTFDNTADIFFDFNAPITTNTETVTIMSTASVGEEVIDRSINVYPNPASAYINLSSLSVLESATVVDINGRVLSQTSFTGNLTIQRVSLESLTSGIYFITIKSGIGQKTDKLIVE